MAITTIRVLGKMKIVNLWTKNKEILWERALNDFTTKYAGSSLGVFWAFIQPAVTILVYWCVFEFGLKATPPVPNVTYIVWFATGMVPWFFFAEGINAVTNSLLEYSYLVKKVLFDVELLPLIKMLSAFFVHIVFCVLLVVVSYTTGNKPSLYSLQLFYYMTALMCLIYAIGKITSAIILFFKDLGQIVNIIIQIGVWATPIIWPYTIVPEKYRWIVKLNPMFYITEGYRDCFIKNKMFWEKPLLTTYFWCVSVFLLIVGNVVFSKLRPHFADVI